MSMAVPAPAGYQIERVDPPAAGDELVGQVVELSRRLEHEQTPDDPPRPAASIAAQFRTTSELQERRWWGAFHGGRLVGGASAGRNLVGSNLHMRDVGVEVLPKHRGRGLGRALFAAAAEAIGEGEGIVVNGWTSSRVPSGELFAERVGAQAKLRMGMNQLDLAAVDTTLMRGWAALDPVGYRLAAVEGGIPERLMPNVIAGFQVMNTMPREGFEMEDWQFTPEIVRDWERQMLERGQEQWMILAIHDATGGTAAFTDVRVDPSYTHVVWQGGTATVPEHRGRGLGKWLKARMLLRILDRLPEARYIRTNNAVSNAAMLAINRTMGFQLVWTNVAWQIPLAEAQRYVRR